MGPPAIPFFLSIGVVGHRAAAVGEAPIEAARPRLAVLLSGLRAAAETSWSRHAALFAATPPQLQLFTSFADGADQIAAEEAVAQNVAVHAILPLPRDDYRRDLSPAALDRFDRLLPAAAGVIELPRQDAGRTASYAIAGRAVVAHCDLLVALWDGEPARGRGGTAETVALAIRRGRPVIHLPLDPSRPACVRWRGYDVFVGDDPDLVPTRAADQATLDALVECLLAPPENPRERGYLEAYLAEHEQRRRLRVEYPLLLAATGTRPIRPAAWRVAPYAASTRAEWEGFHLGREEHGVSAALASVESAYAWSDRLAQHFAQAYRSGHVLNFLLAAVAVLLALAGLLAPALKVSLALAELATILAFVVNTRIGIARGWHRRWLDYRQLAERLRPMRSLKLLGAAGPDIAPGGVEAGPRSWVDWYAAGIWRAAGGVSGVMASDGVARRRFVIAQEVEPQIRYHRENARQLTHLDHRLHAIGMLLFAVSILSCVVFIFAYVADHAWVAARASDFVFLSAGLPALGGAIFGIRTQGDFSATAARSLSTARRLDSIAACLRAEALPLAREVDLAEAAGQVMLADLAEWRTAYEQRRLELPG